MSVETISLNLVWWVNAETCIQPGWLIRWTAALTRNDCGDHLKTAGKGRSRPHRRIE